MLRARTLWLAHGLHPLGLAESRRALLPAVRLVQGIGMGRPFGHPLKAVLAPVRQLDALGPDRHASEDKAQTPRFDSVTAKDIAAVPPTTTRLQPGTSTSPGSNDRTTPASRSRCSRSRLTRALPKRRATAP